MLAIKCFCSRVTFTAHYWLFKTSHRLPCNGRGTRKYNLTMCLEGRRIRNTSGTALMTIASTTDTREKTNDRSIGKCKAYSFHCLDWDKPCYGENKFGHGVQTHGSEWQCHHLGAVWCFDSRVTHTLSLSSSKTHLTKYIAKNLPLEKSNHSVSCYYY